MKHPHQQSTRQLILAFAVLATVLSPAVFSVMRASALDVQLEFPVTGIDSEGPYAQQCEVLFDTYLLSTSLWEDRVSDFAKAIFDNISDRIFDYAKCNLQFIDITAGVLGNGTISKSPICTLQVNDIDAAAKDAAQRELYYNNIVRCTARAMITDVSDKAARIARENGRDGGAAYVQDFVELRLSAEERGRATAQNLFANTRYCPWVQAEMEALFNFHPEEARATTEHPDSNGEPYTQRAECSFPPDTTLNKALNDPSAVYLLSQPQNNIYGSFAMAQEETNRQITLQVEADTTEAIAGSGFLGSRGANAEESCVNRNEQGICLQYAPVVQPGSQIGANLTAATEAEYNWLITSDEVGSLVGDTALRIVNRMQDLTTPDIQFDFTTDAGLEKYLDSRPTPTATPPFEDPDNPSPVYCGLPSETQCSCLANPSDPGYESAQQTARTLISDAAGAAAFKNPQLVTDGVVQPGRNAEFIVQICFELGLSNRGCRPNTPRADDILIFSAGASEIFIDVIRADGRVRTTPTAQYTCAIGVVP